MKIVVTGAAGFLGRRVIDALLAQPGPIVIDGKPRQLEKLVAFDVIRAEGFDDARVEVRAGNLSDAKQLADLIDTQTDAVLHFAAVVSGQAEAEFELGMAVNLDAPRALLERVRILAHNPVLLTTSSVAVFGGELPLSVADDHVWRPQSSYGTQKAVVDLLMADYTRRAFVRGRSLRMPTVSVRPGKPNQAASSFASGIIREPMAGQPAVCPVDPETRLWLMSPDTAVRNILHGLALEQQAFGGQPVVNLPGLSVSVAAMLDALINEGGPSARALVTLKPDPRIQAIVNSWPGHFTAQKALALGFSADADFTSIVRAHRTTLAAHAA
ncbi:D-erythronate dehydrogenase [Pseudomonas sp. UBA1879]|uniref:D-erythronate dehydrogenase n=1 Tax=Pseudomonas sp. UBA1879 TaxID=1947305 RepID=UPI0026007161|nr:D-erythronate dehydrogenase [Pseudomonas sp. UBA1879]